MNIFDLQTTNESIIAVLVSETPENSRHSLCTEQRHGNQALSADLILWLCIGKGRDFEFPCRQPKYCESSIVRAPKNLHKYRSTTSRLLFFITKQYSFLPSRALQQITNHL